MTNLGFADTLTMPRVEPSRTQTAPAYALPSATPPARMTLVTYSGPTRPDLHGTYWLDGWCACGCGQLTLWRKEGDGPPRRLSHVSPSSVTPWRAGR